MNERVLSYHTQDGSLICGGADSSHATSCSKWNSDSGTWNWKFVNLPRIRTGHSSWTPQSGVGTYLMGGSADSWKTNLVKPDGRVELYGFNLHESTYSACSITIPEDDEVILTGGATTRNTVAVYNVKKWQRNLPSLLLGRHGHGCTSFVSGNKRVDNI